MLGPKAQYKCRRPGSSSPGPPGPIQEYRGWKGVVKGPQDPILASGGWERVTVGSRAQSHVGQGGGSTRIQGHIWPARGLYCMHLVHRDKRLCTVDLAQPPAQGWINTIQIMPYKSLPNLFLKLQSTMLHKYKAYHHKTPSNVLIQKFWTFTKSSGFVFDIPSPIE